MTDQSDSISRVLNGRTWEDFCDRLKAAGQIILRPETPATELDRAEGWRYLTRLLRVGLEMMLESSDPDFPSFYMASHPTAKIGADNPDNTYLNATITGDREYRMFGSRGTVPYLSFGSKANRYAIDGTMASTGELESHALKCAPDGSFEVIASAKPQSGNWLPLAPDSSMILVRQTFLDRSREKPASVGIERIGGPERPSPLSAQRLEGGLAAAAAFVHGTARTFADWTQMFRGKPNTLETLDQSLFCKAGGDPRIFYLHGYWAFAEDEALVIDTPVPECEIWNIQVDNYWMESLDYRYLPITVNKHTANYNPDGSVTFVLAAEDRGVGNYLCTGGHETGTLLLRWTGAKTHPVPKCRVVKLAEIGAQSR
jgi:hypothetical protein